MATDLQRARLALCMAPCEYWVTCQGLAAQRGDKWAEYCTAPGPDRTAWRCLSGALLSGPASGCLAGYWDGLAAPAAPTVASDQEPGIRLRRTSPEALSASGGQEPASPCVYGEAECRGCKNRPKVRCHKHDMVVPAASCGNCKDALPLGAVRIGAVITAWNEGAEVAATIESLRASVTEAPLTVILVDDGSTDGSCLAFTRNQEPGTRNIRHDVSQGIGRSRNAGWAAARDLGCDVVTFHDAHMRFERGVLEKLAVMAMQRRCVVSSASRGIPSQGKLAGCWLYYDCRYGFQPHWAANIPPGWQRTPCMMGAGYVLSAETAHQLEAPSGCLWEDTAGRWGFSEQALSIKAYLLGIPVLTNGELAIAHKYRDKNPVPHADRETWKNVARATAVLFGQQVYEERFADWCASHVPAGDLAPILADAFERHASRHSPKGDGGWPVDPATVWTHLLGEGAPITSPHPDHAWLPQVEEACLALTRNQKPGTRNRVVVWRPGEAMMLVRRLLPNAEIHAVEIPGHRLATWKQVCRRAHVGLATVQIGEAYARALPGEWDLALVGGEMQEACKAAASASKVLCNPSADRRQLEDGERKKEKEAIAAATAKGAVLAIKKSPSPSPSNSPSSPAVVTVCLLNWKRPDNLAPILDSIAAQTVPCRVMLWNNPSTGSGRADQHHSIPEHPLVDLVVQSGANLGCFPRWWLAGMARTEWVCSLDDDLAFASPDALEAVLNAALRQAQGQDCVLGAYGVQLIEGKRYKDCRHVHLPADDTAVDIVKGRFMLLRRALLERVPIQLPVMEQVRQPRGLADDIVVSLCVGAGRLRPHLLPGGLKGKFRDLPAGNALSALPDHYERRQRAVEALTPWVKDRGLTTKDTKFTRPIGGDAKFTRPGGGDTA